MALDNDKVIKKLKELMPDDSSNPMLSLLIDELLFEIKSYTHVALADLPDGLANQAALSVYTWIKDTNAMDKVEEAPVSSITDGDETVSFAVSANKTLMASETDLLSEKLKRVLNRYRKLVFD